MTYDVSEKSKSDLYQALLPLVTSGKAELLNHARLRRQALALERTTSRAGRDSISHPPGGHDDIVNAAAGALVLATPKRRAFEGYGDPVPQTPRAEAKRKTCQNCRAEHWTTKDVPDCPQLGWVWADVVR